MLFLSLAALSLGQVPDPQFFDAKPVAAATVTAKPAASDPLWFACRVAVAEGTKTGYGSGTPVSVVDGKTYVLTNAHVVPKASASPREITVTVGGKTYPAKYTDGNDARFFTGPNGQSMVDVDGDDLCLLEVVGEIGAVKVATDIREGETVQQYGYGGVAVGGKPVHKIGVVGRSRFVEPTLVSDIEAIPGDSGCGVFNARGELVGVTHGGTRAVADRFGVIVPAEHCAVPLARVKSFLGRPLLRKLFPNLAAKSDEKRAEKVVPIPAKVTPHDCPCDECDAGKCPKTGGACKCKPVIPSTPRPAGAGWQWDSEKGHWWKYGLPGDANVPPSKCPDGNCPLRQPATRK